MIQRTQTSDVEQARGQLECTFRHASSLVHRLASAVSARQTATQLFNDVECALAKLPLAADEFAVASCRLQNAENYYRKGEFGAACYELRLMARSLCC
jgi:hypothetical protein